MDWDEANAERYETEDTRACLWVPAEGIVVTRASGIGDLGAISIYTRTMDRLLATGRNFEVFHHWLEIKSFRPDAREHLRSWATEHIHRLNDVQYCVGSKLVAMAISVAALALGRNLNVTTQEREFLMKLETALRRH